MTSSEYVNDTTTGIIHLKGTALTIRRTRCGLELTYGMVRHGGHETEMGSEATCEGCKRALARNQLIERTRANDEAYRAGLIADRRGVTE